MQFKEVCGFKFVKVGEAYLCDEPLQNKNGKPVKHGKKVLKDWRIGLKITVDEKIWKAEQSVYLVFKNNDILYVGYFATSFKKRWWAKNGYYLHGETRKKVNKLVKANNDISVWLSVNPYAGKLNISKCIEDEIIIKYMGNRILLNTVGKNLKKDREATLTVQKILDIKN